MASADFSPALTGQLSPGKVLILFLRAVRLYLARLVWILGFAVASTLTARTRPLCRFVFLQSKYLFPASFGFHRAACAPRLPLCGSLRLPPSVPAGSFHPARISPCWAHWRTSPDVPCRHSWRHVLPPGGQRRPSEDAAITSSILALKQRAPLAATFALNKSNRMARLTDAVWAQRRPRRYCKLD